MGALALMAVVTLSGNRLGYTVRPDIWPLGSDILVEWGALIEVPACVEDRSWVKPMVTQWEREALDAGLGDPGVAEALVLAGHVSNRG